MTSQNPIAALLNLPPRAEAFEANGQTFEYHPAREATCETVYRKAPGHGIGNPGFTLALVPEAHHAMVLGQYLARRSGVKRADAEAITAAARRA